MTDEPLELAIQSIVKVHEAAKIVTAKKLSRSLDLLPKKDREFLLSVASLDKINHDEATKVWKTLRANAVHFNGKADGTIKELAPPIKPMLDLGGSVEVKLTYAAILKIYRGIVERLVEKEHYIYVPTWKQMMTYSDGRYIEVNDEMVRGIIRERLPEELNNNSGVDEVFRFVKDTSSRHPADFDADPKYINVKNGLYNRETGKLESHTPKHLSIRQIATDYVEGAECPYIESLFRQWVDDDYLRLAQIVAWCLEGDYDVQSFLSLLGPGDNGKSTFEAILVAFLGTENVSAVTIAALADQRFALAEIYGRLANVVGQGGASVRDQDKILALTGGDGVMWEKKFGHPWSEPNRTKMILASNWVATVKRLTKAWIRRFEPLFFLHEFRKDDPKYPLKTQSEIIAAARAEFPGLLNWAISLSKTLRTEKWDRQYTEEAKRFIYRIFSDPVFIFLQHYVRDDKNAIPKHDLYTAFLDECTKHEFPALLGEYDFFKALQGAAPYVIEVRENDIRKFRGLRHDPSKCGPLFELCVAALARFANFGRTSPSSTSPPTDTPSQQPSPDTIGGLKGGNVGSQETTLGADEDEDRVNPKIAAAKAREVVREQRTLEQAEPALKPVVDATVAVQAKVAHARPDLVGTPVKGGWLCPICGTVNTKRYYVCSKCGKGLSP